MPQRRVTKPRHMAESGSAEVDTDGHGSCGDSGEMKAEVLATPENKLAPFNPTCDEAINAALAMADLGPDDTLLDVGCGDGRLLIQAAKEFGIQCSGIEYDKEFVARAHATIETEGIGSLVSVVHADALATEWPVTSVVFIYLTPTGIGRAKPKLVAAAQRGARVIASVFSISDWTPAQVRRPRGIPVYLYEGKSALVGPTPTTSQATKSTPAPRALAGASLSWRRQYAVKLARMVHARAEELAKAQATAVPEAKAAPPDGAAASGAPTGGVAAPAAVGTAAAAVASSDAGGAGAGSAERGGASDATALAGSPMCSAAPAP